MFWRLRRRAGTLTDSIRETTIGEVRNSTHIEAFEFFAGAPRRLVSDNLKTGVIKPDIYDPLLNRSYAELATYYGCLVDPARSLKPKDKPRVERQMPYVRDSMWCGWTFLDRAQMRSGALTWCVDVAGVRHHRSLDGASPISVFRAVEQEALLPLPKDPFELATWSRPKIGPDCYAKAGRALWGIHLSGPQVAGAQHIAATPWLVGPDVVVSRVR